ncbi:uncharacterized protein UHOD_11945 [Ustilago sp. UG-2017b]|nr:uncharacterized protein UHOD_11945 [Ustilago sp. UG-2017b]
MLKKQEGHFMGLNGQEAGRLLVHMEGAQVSGDQTDRRGEAVDLAGTGSKHGRSTVSMETMDEEACITNSHAEKDQAHMQGGLSAYARRAKHRQEEDQAQGACRRVLLRDSRDRGQRNRCQSKGKEQCIGNRQVGPEEEEQCRRSRHSSGGQEWC